MGVPSPGRSFDGGWDACYWWDVKTGPETSQIFVVRDRSVGTRREGLCLVENGELRAWMRPESGYGRRFEFAGVTASIESLSRAWILQRGYNLRIGQDVTVEAEFPGWFRHNRMDIRVQGALSHAEVAFVALALLTGGPSS